MKKVKQIILGANVEVTIPSEFKYASCKCGKRDIIWATTKNGKSMPIRWDKWQGWISHFVDCPLANKFRKKKEQNGNNNNN